MANIINAITTGGGGISTTADASGSIQFATNNGTTAMTIDTSQNVGIGTTSPASKLDVNGAIRSTSGTTLLVASVTGGIPYIQGYDGTTSANNQLAFYTGSAERMRIDNVGNVLVGTTSLPANGGLLFVAGGISSNSGYQTKAGNTSALSGNRFNINWTGTAQLWIDSTNIGTFAFTSDYRIKKNIETSTTPALERISQIRPVTYQMADYGTLFKASEEVKEGFIAHELAEVIPSAVEGEKDAEDQIQSLKLDALCSVMVKAIQEQQTIINELKSRITALEGAK